MASARPTGPTANPLLVRTIAGLSIVVVLVGVIAVFTKGSGSSSPSTAPAVGNTTPAVTPTPSRPAGRTPTPAPSPSATASRAARPTPASTASPAGTTRPVGSLAASSVPSRPNPSPSPAGGSGPTVFAPAIGSYSYATTGGEQTSFPGTARHYPATTTITIAKAGCGVDQTWTPIKQHSETEQLCIVNNQVHLASYSTTISYFGQTITQKFTCASNAFIYSPTLRPGHSWSFTCSGSGAKVTQHLTAVAFSTIAVGSAQIRTLHLTATSKISGAEGGTTREDYWIQTGSHPFVIRNTAQVTAKNGSITYSEAYSIQLKKR